MIIINHLKMDVLKQFKLEELFIIRKISSITKMKFQNHQKNPN